MKCKKSIISCLNIFGLSNIIKKRDNVINSLNGKVKYLKDKLEDKE